MPDIEAPLFTIVTSTYNAAAALPATARSIEAQTCRDFEWLIVDGGSTDDTVRIATELGARVEQLEWQGFALQKNAAIAMARERPGGAPCRRLPR